LRGAFALPDDFAPRAFHRCAWWWTTPAPLFFLTKESCAGKVFCMPRRMRWRSSREGERGASKASGDNRLGRIVHGAGTTLAERGWQSSVMKRSVQNGLLLFGERKAASRLSGEGRCLNRMNSSSTCGLRRGGTSSAGGYGFYPACGLKDNGPLLTVERDVAAETLDVIIRSDSSVASSAVSGLSPHV
jgi:hypothetical protein